jgi:hypothetical protein
MTKENIKTAAIVALGAGVLIAVGAIANLQRKNDQLTKSVFISCRKTDWMTGDKCRKITEEVLNMSEQEVNSYVTVFGN